jgi:hypothetical protein
VCNIEAGILVYTMARNAGHTRYSVAYQNIEAKISVYTVAGNAGHTRYNVPHQNIILEFQCTPWPAMLATQDIVWNIRI